MLVQCQLALSKRAGQAWPGLAQCWQALVMYTLPMRRAMLVSAGMFSSGSVSAVLECPETIRPT